MQCIPRLVRAPTLALVDFRNSEIRINRGCQKRFGALYNFELLSGCSIQTMS